MGNLSTQHQDILYRDVHQDCGRLDIQINGTEQRTKKYSQKHVQGISDKLAEVIQWRKDRLFNK